MPKNIHENHRDRLRERFRKEGLGHFEPHQVLELLLFYAIPRRDVNPVAHELLLRFGSLRAVLDTPYEHLRTVPGMTENAALFLTLLPQLARSYAIGGEPEHPFLLEPDILRSYLMARYVGVRVELPLLLCLDSAGKLKDMHEFPAGTFSAVGLDLRVLAEQIIRKNASAVILAHNHPGGKALPSPEDIETTRRAAWLFKEIRVRLCDHVICAGSELFSMAADKRLMGLFI
ncbi:MAG: hypothetical protein LBJ12_06800 [Oscillospiraceae bacterium]|jgi:DNA repair protein RadC|nr:hypothetical protein [Oscillospiraceae bacterium]